MKDNDIILFAALAVGAVFYMKKSHAAAPPATRPGYPPAASQTQNVNGAMWTSLLGREWTSMGGSLFGKNGLGQLVTSDGKPVSSEMQPLMGDGYTQSVDYGDTPNYIDAAFPSLADLEWQ